MLEDASGGGGSANTNPLPSGPGSPFTPLDTGTTNSILQMPSRSAPLALDIDCGKLAEIAGLGGLLQGGFNIQTGPTLSELGSANNLTSAHVSSVVGKV